MFIDKRSPIPAYYQLKGIILDKIREGEYRADEIIPSEREFSDSLNISRMTVRQALNQLVAEGVLYREKGKGTFVSKPKIEQRNIMSFSDLVRKKGLTPSTKILNFEKVKPSVEICNALEITGKDLVYNLKRLRLADNSPIGIEEVFIPERYCPRLERYDLTDSLYRLVRDEFRHIMDYVDNVIETVRPGKTEKELLEIKSSIPVLKISAIYYTKSGIRLFYEKSTYRSDEYKYSVRVYVDRDME